MVHDKGRRKSEVIDRFAINQEASERAGVPKQPADIRCRACIVFLTMERDIQDEWQFVKGQARQRINDLIAGGTQYSGFAFKGYLRLPRVIGPIEVVGPHAATDPTRTPSREKLFICKPEVPEQERACAERITQDLAGRAFRRPVTKKDIDGLMAFYDAGHEGSGGFNAGMSGSGLIRLCSR